MPPLGTRGRSAIATRVLLAMFVSVVPAVIARPAMAAGAAEAEVAVRTETVEVGVGAQPRLFTVACGPDEELLSGGYLTADPALRVVSSYPSDVGGTATGDGQQPRAWTVGAVNSGRTAVGMRVAATCLRTDDAAQATVTAVTATRTESSFTVSARCDSGPPRTGGGYSEVVRPSAGTADAGGIRSSYPVERGWGIDVVAGPPDPNVRAGLTVTVYAVCLSTKAVELRDGVPVELDLVAGSAVCTGATPFAAASCVTPRSGQTVATCPTGQRLAGAGYRADPGLSTSAVVASGPVAGSSTGAMKGPVWTVSVRGSTPVPAVGVAAAPTAGPARVSVFPVCLALAVASTGPETVVALPLPGGVSNAGPIIVASALSLLLIVLLVVLMLRRRRSRRRPLPPGVEIVVRGSRGGYRIGGSTR